MSRTFADEFEEGLNALFAEEWGSYTSHTQWQGKGVGYVE